MGLRFSIINISSFLFVFFFIFIFFPPTKRARADHPSSILFSIVLGLAMHLNNLFISDSALEATWLLIIGGKHSSQTRQAHPIESSLIFLILHAFYTPSVPDFLISFLSLHFSVVSSSLSLLLHALSLFDLSPYNVRRYVIVFLHPFLLAISNNKFLTRFL